MARKKADTPGPSPVLAALQQASKGLQFTRRTRMGSSGRDGSISSTMTTPPNRFAANQRKRFWRMLSKPTPPQREGGVPCPFLQVLGHFRAGLLAGSSARPKATLPAGSTAPP